MRWRPGFFMGRKLGNFDEYSHMWADCTKCIAHPARVRARPNGLIKKGDKYLEDFMAKNEKRVSDASIGARLVAKIIDSFIAFLVVIIAVLFSFITMELYYVVLGLGMLALLGYQVYLLSKNGQTIGKKIMKIKVVRLETGENGGFIPNCLLRAGVNNVLSLIPLYGLVDVLLIFSESKRCIHDKLAGTIVVDARS